MTNQDNLKKADAVVATSAGTSAVAIGAPLVPVKMAATAVGGKGALIALAAKSTVLMGQPEQQHLQSLPVPRHTECGEFSPTKSVYCEALVFQLA